MIALLIKFGVGFFLALIGSFLTAFAVGERRTLDPQSKYYSSIGKLTRAIIVVIALWGLTVGALCLQVSPWFVLSLLPALVMGVTIFPHSEETEQQEEPQAPDNLQAVASSTPQLPATIEYDYAEYEEAFRLITEYGAVLAECSSERMLYKPISRLPADRTTLRKAIKFVYSIHWMDRNEAERVFGDPYIMLADFFPDDYAHRANEYMKHLSSGESGIDPKLEVAYEFVSEESIKNMAMYKHDWERFVSELENE